MLGLSQLPGLDPETRGAIAADAVLADPASGARAVELAILAAVTDYRRAFARVVLEEGADIATVFRAMGRVPVRGRLPVALTAPLSPGGDVGQVAP